MSGTLPIDVQTHGIRVTVRPRYLAERSLPQAARYVFTYAVRIENVGAQTVQLLTRRWLIHDDLGEELEVAGEGVIGVQPVLGPGEVHEYESFCILKSPSGFMEGHYAFVADDGVGFRALIPRCTLEAPDA